MCYFEYYMIFSFTLMKSFFIVFSLFVLCWVSSNAQVDSSRVDTVNQLNEIVVTGYQSHSPKYTSINIEPFSLEKINEKTPFNLSDAMSKIPGVSQMSTGNAISKPVIRGLYGNRILVLLSGARFDNQQWQDEHGLGLSQIGIDRVELIKGPSSLLYGSDAMGGVINIIEEKPETLGVKYDAGTQIYTNTGGTLSDIGFAKKTVKNWFRIRIGIENHADYSDGNGARVLNSRNQGYYLKAGYGFEKKNWKQENSYNFSINQFGFILEDTGFTVDNRWSRAMAGPHHIVILNLLNSQNTFYLKQSVLKLNAGIQSNSRREDEGGGQISLNMHLISVLQSLRWEKSLNPHLFFVGNQQLTYENNTNYGGRILIPDANLLEGNTSAYIKWTHVNLILEGGIGVNYKWIQTILTRSLNVPGELIQPFQKNSIASNGMLGGVYNFKTGITCKANIASGFRAPNLAELSSNGVHEGVYRYELGDPNLKVEQNFNSDFSLEYNSNQFFFSGSVFYNRFLNYIYLAPLNRKYFGFDMFKFKQQNALITGGEILAIMKLKSMKGLQWKEGFTFTNGKLDNGIYLPFIPAYKVASSIRYEKNLKRKITSCFIEAEYLYLFRQDHPSVFETATADYGLINLFSGATLKASHGNWRLGFNITNLTNSTYADHLSRIKYYGLYNPGINFVISVRKAF